MKQHLAFIIVFLGLLLLWFLFLVITFVITKPKNKKMVYFKNTGVDITAISMFFVMLIKAIIAMTTDSDPFDPEIAYCFPEDPLISRAENLLDTLQEEQFHRYKYLRMTFNPTGSELCRPDRSVRNLNSIANYTESEALKRIIDKDEYLQIALNQDWSEADKIEIKKCRANIAIIKDLRHHTLEKSEHHTMPIKRGISEEMKRHYRVLYSVGGEHYHRLH